MTLDTSESNEHNEPITEQNREPHYLINQWKHDTWNKKPIRAWHIREAHEMIQRFRMMQGFRWKTETMTVRIM